ncbi:MAG: hypothetical protein QN183_05210 [Armatimonadota bacterium]|nr:hypothetical protein [Armatimonadota bacterium]MDR7533757.1 hypothetical protein [Armatimonadota bacterium]MDR7535747.1 hypothetical protein [Armatimonadota bacterium]
MPSSRGFDVRDVTLARLGDVEVSRFETPTGPRLRLRRLTREPAEAWLDPLELEGLTRARHLPWALLPGPHAPPDEALLRAAAGAPLERLQNEFALVGVAIARAEAAEALFVRDMNAGLGILLSAQELEALLRARHMDFAPLVDTSDLVALPEPDIDEG